MRGFEKMPEQTRVNSSGGGSKEPEDAGGGGGKEHVVAADEFSPFVEVLLSHFLPLQISKESAENDDAAASRELNCIPITDDESLCSLYNYLKSTLPVRPALSIPKSVQPIIFGATQPSPDSETLSEATRCGLLALAYLTDAFNVSADNRVNSLDKDHMQWAMFFLLRRHLMGDELQRIIDFCRLVRENKIGVTGITTSVLFKTFKTPFELLAFMLSPALIHILLEKIKDFGMTYKKDYGLLLALQYNAKYWLELYLVTLKSQMAENSDEFNEVCSFCRKALDGVFYFQQYIWNEILQVNFDQLHGAIALQSAGPNGLKKYYVSEGLVKRCLFHAVEKVCINGIFPLLLHSVHSNFPPDLVLKSYSFTRVLINPCGPEEGDGPKFSGYTSEDNACFQAAIAHFLKSPEQAEVGARVLWPDLNTVISVGKWVLKMQERRAMALRAQQQRNKNIVALRISSNQLNLTGVEKNLSERKPFNNTYLKEIDKSLLREMKGKFAEIGTTTCRLLDPGLTQNLAADFHIRYSVELGKWVKMVQEIRNYDHKKKSNETGALAGQVERTNQVINTLCALVQWPLDLQFIFLEYITTGMRTYAPQSSERDEINLAQLQAIFTEKFKVHPDVAQAACNMDGPISKVWGLVCSFNNYPERSAALQDATAGSGGGGGGGGAKLDGPASSAYSSSRLRSNSDNSTRETSGEESLPPRARSKTV
jgi:hypothetical protein